MLVFVLGAGLVVVVGATLVVVDEV